MIHFQGNFKNTTQHILFLTPHNVVLCLCFVNQGQLLCGFLGTCLSGPEEPSEEEGKDKTTLFCSQCVQSAERGVKYQNDPNIEEVLSHQHSILVLHDPRRADCTSLI